MAAVENEIARLQNALSSRAKTTVVTEATVLSFVFCMSVVGNLLVFFAVWRNHRLRSISNLFVVALGISDILMAILCVPYTIGTLTQGRWLYGHSFCQAHGFFAFSLGLASLQTMGLVAINRYFCIVKPAHYPTKFTFRRTIFYILIVWCNALIGAIIPFFFNFGAYTFQPGKAMCLYTFEANIPYTIFIEVVYIGLPLSMIMSCYFSVFRTVYRSNKIFAVQGNNTNQEELRSHVKETKVTKTLVIVFLGFSSCWMPISIIDYLDAINGAPIYKREVYLTYSFLAYISTFLNPIIYGATNRAFRREYIAIFKKIFCCSNVQGYMSRSMVSTAVSQQT